MARKAQNTVDEDRIHREGVLMFLLHEVQLATIEEIVAQRQAPVAAARQQEIRDGTERAITDLAGVGVVNVEGHFVYATRAARETSNLIEGTDQVGGERRC